MQEGTNSFTIFNSERKKTSIRQNKARYLEDKEPNKKIQAKTTTPYLILWRMKIF